MKKIVRILGISLVVASIVSCSKDDVDNSLPTVSTSTVAGTYSYAIAVTQTPFDYNKDGVLSQDLFAEGYNACGLDDQIVITETSYTILKKGVACNVGEKNEVYEYKLDETLKTLTLYENGKVFKTFEKVYVQKDDKGKNELIYEVFDTTLNQIVYFKLAQ